MQQHGNNCDHGKVLLKSSQMVVATVLGLVAAAAVSYHRRKSSSKAKRRENSKIVPKVFRTESGRVGNVERFSHYVARQIGFEDPNECPEFCKLAYDYLRKLEGIEDAIYGFLANEPEAETLYVQLIEEFDRCILSYFGFHWKQAPRLISQVMKNEDSEKKTKLKDFVMTATRKQRFERITRSLKVTRVFSTLVEEMKAISKVDSSRCTNVMAPMALCDRSPVLLLMGGGMGAGKSTVIKDILKEPFWAEAAANAVVVEADAFKETDVVYQTLNSMGHHDDIMQTSELVHKSSTDAASSLLVTALNEGRDVIMDGTLSWEPFVDQTIAMARNVHNCRYRMGVGYRVAEDGTVTENYWESIPLDESDYERQENGGTVSSRKPYRIELVGVVCDAYLAVVRGIRRAILTGRAVRVSSQLKSHKSFAKSFPRYCELADNARLYCTNAVGGPPSLIAWKDRDSKLLIEPEEIKWLTHITNLNSDAESVYELYPNPSPVYEPGTVWTDFVMSPSRPNFQSELKTAIQRIEQYPALPTQQTPSN